MKRTALANNEPHLEGAHWSLVLFWILGAGLVLAIGYEAFTTQIITRHFGSDFYEHSAAVRALLEEGFRPASPMAVSDVGSPRYMPHFVLLAAAGRVLSLDALETMALGSTVNVALFVLGIFLFYRALFRDPRAPLYGLIVMLGSWYSAWLYSNVYQLHVLFGVASYPSQAALGLTMIALALALRIVRSARVPWGRLALLTALFASILLVHAVTAVMALTATGLLALTAPGVPKRMRGLLLSTTCAGALLALLWPHFSLLSVVLGTGGGHPSWLSGLPGEGRLQPRFVTDSFQLETVFQTLGLAVLGVVSIGFFLARRIHLFIGLSAVAMLLPFLLGFVIRIPLGTRFILLTAFFLHVGLVWMLLMISPGFHERSRPLRWAGLARTVVVLALLLMSVHSVRLAASLLRTNTRGQPPGQRDPEVLTLRRVAALAGPGAVLIGRRYELWPLPTFGVKIVDLRHINPLLPDSGARRADTGRFLAPETTSAERDEIVRRYRVTHVLLREEPAPALAEWLREMDTPSRSVGGDLTLYSLRGPLH